MKLAVITGGTRGIGKSISEMYLKKGYEVVVNYGLSDEGARVFLEENKEFVDRIIVIKEDLSKKDGLESFVRKIKSLEKNIDALVLNVGITKRERFEDITYESWDNVFNSNLKIPFFLVQKLYNNINESAHIVFISSVLGFKADGASMQYGISKGAILPMVKYLSKEFAVRDITVNAIAPGFINTDWQVSKPEEQKRRISDKTILKRFGNPDEISKVCDMLSENKYITGQMIMVDGGYGL